MHFEGEDREVKLPFPTGEERLKFLNQEATAQLLGLSERTLERFRLEGRGPSFRKFGRRVMYAISDLIAWTEHNRRSSTSDPGLAYRGGRVKPCVKNTIIPVMTACGPQSGTSKGS